MAAPQPQSSPMSTPAPETPVFPVKRKRGRPPKAETIARREAEQRAAAAAAAAAAASQPPTSIARVTQQQQSAPPVIPEPVSDSDEPVENDPVPVPVPVPALPQAPMSVPSTSALPSHAPVPAVVTTGTPTLPEFQSMSQPISSTLKSKREEFTIVKEEQLDSEAAADLVSLYSSMNEPALKTAIDVLSKKSCSPNELYHELSRLPEKVKREALDALPIAPPTKKYVLHRGLPSHDIFSSPLSLSNDDLAKMSQSKDTDVIALAGPSVVPRSAPPPMRDVVPRYIAKRAYVAHSAPRPVEHLYYSPFSSFAPTHDSTNATLPFKSSLAPNLLADAAGEIADTSSVLSSAERAALKAIGVPERELVLALTSGSAPSSSLPTSEYVDVQRQLDQNVERIRALLVAQRNRLRSATPSIPTSVPIVPPPVQWTTLSKQVPQPSLVASTNEELVAKSLFRTLTRLVVRLGERRRSTEDFKEEDGVAPSEGEVERAMDRFREQVGTRGTRGTLDAANPGFARPVRMP